MNFLKSLWQMMVGAGVGLTGEWEGSYGFGDSYPIENQRLRVSFIAHLRGTGKQFEGSVKEDSNGIPETSTIDGSISGRKISFVKTYRKSYTINDVNKITANDHGPQYVNYTGVYDPATKAFSGTWSIDATYYFTDATQKNVVNTGTWEMRRRVL